MKLWRNMTISFSIHIFKEGLTNVWMVRNVDWHLVQSLLVNVGIFFLFFFIT